MDGLALFFGTVWQLSTAKELVAKRPTTAGKSPGFRCPQPGLGFRVWGLGFRDEHDTEAQPGD